MHFFYFPCRNFPFGIKNWRALLQLGLQFVGRVVGEHVHTGRLHGEEMTDNLGGEPQHRTEIAALHVAEDGTAQLTGHQSAV